MIDFAMKITKTPGNINEEDSQKLKQHGFNDEDIWDIVGRGCSWYCGGGPKKVSASSYLSSQGKINYKPLA